MTIELETPQSRVEEILATMAGVEGIELEEPISRIEKWLMILMAVLDSREIGMPIIVDDTTFKRYRVGMRDGELYVLEVEDNG